MLPVQMKNRIGPLLSPEIKNRIPATGKKATAGLSTSLRFAQDDKRYF